jgi:hypothetical protein
MSQSSSPGSLNSIKSSEAYVGNKRSPQTPPSKPNAWQHDTAKLPNFSIDEIDEEDGYASLTKNAITCRRYDDSIKTADMAEAGCKYAEQGLIRTLYCSFTRNLALERSLVQEATARLSHISASLDPETPRQATAAEKLAEMDRKVRNVRREASGRRRVDEPSSKWRCCKCKRGHELYTFEQDLHPVSVLSCSCTHRSCVRCTLEGLVKQFVPMNEPEVVPLSEDRTKSIRFGVFCDGCGLSWRAEVVKDQDKPRKMMKSALQRISAVPRHIKKHGPHPLERIRTSRSMNSLSSLALPPSEVPLTASKSALNLRALSNEMEREHGEQAKLVSVRFTGIKCSCSMATDATSLCFQIVDPPKDFHIVQFAKQMAERNVAGFGSTPADEQRGHGTPTLTLKNGVRHPNPLTSNPVQ